MISHHRATHVRCLPFFLIFVFIGFSAFAQSVNDDCINASPLQIGTAISGTTIGALTDDEIACGAFNSAAGAVWYQVTGTGSLLSASLENATFYAGLRIYAGRCDSLVCIAGHFTSFAGWRSTVDAQYYILINGYDAEEGTFDLIVEEESETKPCLNPEPLSLPALVTGNTDTLSREMIEVCSVAGFIKERSRWFTVTGRGKTIIASSCNTNFVSDIRIYSDNCDSLICINTLINPCTNIQSSISWDGVENEIYLINLSGYLGSSGDFELSVTEGKKLNAITFEQLQPVGYSNEEFELTASSTSGLEIQYTSSDTSVASISGNVVTIHAIGETWISASDSGNHEYDSTETVYRLLTVVKGEQKITFEDLPVHYVGDGPFKLHATSSSGLPVVFESNFDATATLSGDTVVIHRMGAVEITASQPGNENYDAAQPITRTLAIKTTETDKYIVTGSATPGVDGCYQLTPDTLWQNGALWHSEQLDLRADFDLHFKINLCGEADGIMFVLQNYGLATINNESSAGGNLGYYGSPQFSNSLAIEFDIWKNLEDETYDQSNSHMHFVHNGVMFPRNTPVEISPLLGDCSDRVLRIKWHSNLKELEVFLDHELTMSSLENNISEIFFGDPMVYFGFTGSTGSNSARQKIFTKNIPQKIFFDSLSFKNVRESHFILPAFATSGLPLTYTSSNAEVAIISGDTVIVKGEGVTYITASQAGSDVFLPATDVTRQLNIIAAHDVCTSAITLHTADTIYGSTIWTNPVIAPICNVDNGTGGGAWYKVTGEGQMISASLCESNFDTKLRIFSGTCDSLICITGNDDYCSYGSKTSWLAESGKSYFILVDGYGNSSGEFKLSITQDDTPCFMPDHVLTVPETIQSSTALADEMIVPDCNGSFSESEKVKWYIVRGTGKRITASTCSTYSDFDTRLTIFEGECNNLTCIEANDDYCETLSSVSWSSEDGKDYILAVYGYNGYGGNFELSVKGSEENIISFEQLPQIQFDLGRLILEATASSGLPVSYSSSEANIASISGDTVVIHSVGMTTITAVQEGNENFDPAIPVEQVLVVNKADQAISFNQPLVHPLNERTVELTAFSNSGLPISYSSLDSTTISITENFVTLLREGSATIFASQNGNENYHAANSVQRELIIQNQNDDCENAMEVSINSITDGSTTWAESDSVTSCDDGHNGSGGGVWYKVQGNGHQLTVSLCNSDFDTQVRVFSGSCHSLACVAGNDDACARQSFVEWLSEPLITYYILINGYDDQEGEFRLEVIDQSDSNPCIDAVALQIPSIVSGDTRTAKTANLLTCESSSVTSQAAWYIILGSGKTITASLCSNTTYDSKISVFTGGCESMQCVVENDDFCSVQSKVSWGGEIGVAYLICIYGFNGSAGLYELSIEEGKGINTITMEPFPTVNYGDPGFELSATSTSGSPVSFSSSNESIATISARVVAIHAAGTTTITASASGNEIYADAVPLQRSLIINKADQNITFPQPVAQEIGDSFNPLATATSGLPIHYLTMQPDRVVISSDSITVLIPGSLTLEATQEGNANYNPASPVFRTLCINPAKPILTLQNGTTIISNTDAEHLWYFDSLTIDNINGSGIEVSEAGLYSAKVVVEGCYSEQSNRVELVITGAAAIDSKSITFYPNPVRDELYMDLSSLRGNDIVDVSFYDMIGRIVNSLSVSGSAIAKFDVSSFIPGQYIVKVNIKQKEHRFILTKQ